MIERILNTLIYIGSSMALSTLMFINLSLTFADNESEKWIVTSKRNGYIVNEYYRDLNGNETLYKADSICARNTK